VLVGPGCVEKARPPLDLSAARQSCRAEIILCTAKICKEETREMMTIENG
jgi:hypothetical protein